MVCVHPHHERQTNLIVDATKENHKVVGFVPRNLIDIISKVESRKNANTVNFSCELTIMNNPIAAMKLNGRTYVVCVCYGRGNYVKILDTTTGKWETGEI